MWIRINGLTYNSELYGSCGTVTGFRIKNGLFGSWVYLSAETGTKRTYAGTFSGLECGTTYVFYGQACWAGTWWDVTGGTFSTSSCTIVAPSVPWSLSSSVSGRSVTLNYRIDANTRSVQIDRYNAISPNIITINHSSSGLYSHTFTANDFNTTYNWDIRAYSGSSASGNSSSWSNIQSYRTGSPPAPSTPSSPTLDNRVDGGFKVSWGSVNNADSYTLRIRRGYDSVTTTYLTTSTNYTVTGLLYGVGYHISVRANNDGGSSSYSGENPVTTAPATPTITTYDVTNDAFSVQYSDISGNFTEVLVNVYTGSGTWTLRESKTITPPTTTARFTGLTSGTTYTIRAWSRFFVNNTWLESINNSYNIQAASSRPENWTWTTAKISGNTFNVTATEWNNFCARINAFRAYKSPTLYPAVSFTSAVSGQPATATQINQARTAINAMSPPTAVPSAVTSGGNCLPSTINGLSQSLNSIL